jgi:predicted transcriptional regulator
LNAILAPTEPDGRINTPNLMNRTFFLFSSFPKMELGPLEERLLHALWKCRSATVRELIDDCDIQLAYTTVMTTLDRLYKKKLLKRVVEGRAFRYSPRLTQEELQKEAASKAIRQLLTSNKASSLPLSYLVDAVGEHDAKLLEDLKELVERKRRELQNEEDHDV